MTGANGCWVYQTGRWHEQVSQEKQTIFRSCSYLCLFVCLCLFVVFVLCDRLKIPCFCFWVLLQKRKIEKKRQRDSACVCVLLCPYVRACTCVFVCVERTFLQITDYFIPLHVPCQTLLTSHYNFFPSSLPNYNLFCSLTDFLFGDNFVDGLLRLYNSHFSCNLFPIRLHLIAL